MFTIIIFILILSILVMIHELGHFIMAKRAGIGVEEFGFGLPPRIWGKKHKGTIYSINWLPFGGFVKLVGEDATDRDYDAKNSFHSKSLPARITVVLAGVFMNFVLAVVLFYVLLFSLGFKSSLPAFFEHKFRFVNQTIQVLVSDVSEGTAAKNAGLQPGDSIIDVGGEPINSIDGLQKIVRSNEGKKLNFTLENAINNQRRQVEITPTFNTEINAPAIGVGLGELVVLNYETFFQKMFAGFIHSYNLTSYSLNVFGRLIGYAIQTGDFTPVSEGISGPVGIAQITGQAVALGWQPVVQLVALLSLNLAIMNVLPIPALDGGRFLFLLVETVTRKKVYPVVEKWVHTIGFVVLIGLILLVTYNDILKILK